jgi:hypothetical protein
LSARRVPLWLGLALCGALASGCTSTLLDAPSKVREDKVPLAPLFSPFYASSASEDGSSWSWSALLWLIGADAEADRSTARALPIYWSSTEGDAATSTLVFPLYYGHTAGDTRWTFWTPFWGTRDAPESRQDWVLLNAFDVGYSKVDERKRSGLILAYDYENHGGTRRDFSIMPIWGLAHLFHLEWGYPAEGVEVGALGRQSSRRLELLNFFRFITLFGYDDVGDRTDWRLLTLLDSEMLSPVRSWRGRGDDPFVSEWVFPLYMNRQDAAGGWLYVGPIWGQRIDRVEESTVDWWLLGLVSRTTAPEGNTWKVFGLPVSGP